MTPLEQIQIPFAEWALRPWGEGISLWVGFVSWEIQILWRAIQDWAKEPVKELEKQKKQL